MAKLALRRRGVDGEGVGDEPSPGLPWHLAAIAGAVVSALAGLVLTIGLTTMGWVQVPDVSFWSNLSLGTRWWLLGHGAGAQVGNASISVVPLGLTALFVLAASGAAGHAAHQLRRTMDPRAGQLERRSAAVRVAVLFGLVYLGCVMVPSFLVHTAAQSGHAFLGGIAVGFGSGLLGASRALGWHPSQQWPDWARAIPRAVAAACLVLVATGALVLTITLWMHRDRVADLHAALVPGASGGIILVVAQLFWLPNFVLWCTSWALGAGLSIGTGTVISPAQNMTGLLPGLPALGAVPANGPGPKVALLWLLSGVVAGVVAAVVIGRARRQARFDETSLVGGLSGVLAGLVVWLLAAASNGDLGSERLTSVGARLPELAVMAPTVMGLSGMAAGLVMGLLNPPPPVVDDEADVPASEDELVDWPELDDDRD